MGAVAELTGASFEQDVLKSEVPVLVDFWAPWCGPCRHIAPVVEELALENGESVKVAKVNIDDHPGIAESYGISSIPTLMVFKAGDVVERLVGVQPKQRMQEVLDAAKG
ncbi:MAG: thioredoxin [Planctomycetota bacterium]|nr:MAG: thioredoxin [Planctomycetota bacterium]REJ87193.1 MAG: thioredoxin [Planctomycetota bacterium]REK23843.1 MAG: thioredoxin [Planctomycetota bacterium]REK40605.1 MAG: thioredoxin [Planctomycetota bacterium]